MIKLKVILADLHEYQIQHYCVIREHHSDVLQTHSWLILSHLSHEFFKSCRWAFLIWCTRSLSSYLLYPLVYCDLPLCCNGLKNLGLADNSDEFCCTKEKLDKSLDINSILLATMHISWLLNVINNPLFHLHSVLFSFQEIRVPAFLFFLLF